MPTRASMGSPMAMTTLCLASRSAVASGRRRWPPLALLTSLVPSSAFPLSADAPSPDAQYWTQAFQCNHPDCPSHVTDTVPTA